MLKSLFAWIFDADAETVEPERIGNVPSFSRLAISTRPMLSLPDGIRDALAEKIVDLTEAPGAVFVMPDAFAGVAAADCEFYPETDAHLFIRPEGKTDEAVIDFSSVSPEGLSEPSVRDALLVLLAYPTVCRVVR